MKRPYLSFLHCIIALLACCTGLFANAEQLDSQSGTFTPNGAETPLFSWTYHNDVKGNTYYPNCRVQLVDETKFSEYTKVLVICQLWQGTNAKQDNVINLSELDANHSAQGYCTFADMQAGEYRTTLVVKFFDNNNTEKANYTLNLDNITVENGTEQPSTDPTGVFTYTITGNRCDFEVVLSNTDGHELKEINVWAEAEGISYFKQTSTSNPFKGSFTVTGLKPGETKEYYVKAEAIFNDYTIGGGDKNNMVGTDVAQTFTGVETSDDDLVKVIDSETYSDGTYKTGISYTAAKITDDAVKWTYPEWAKTDYTEEQLGYGISGRYVVVEKSSTLGWWAPTIKYTIGNDANGYIHATFDIPGDVPQGFNPSFVVNNNPQNGAVTKGDDGKWHFKSLNPYPNNRTISYFFRAAWENGGQLQTRSFGYKLENVTNESSEPFTLTSLAEAKFGAGDVSGQIYICHAHDPWTPLKDNEVYDGYWISTHRPSDYANLNTEQFHFCPAFEYIIANKASEPGKVYFAVKFIEDANTVIPTDFKPVFNIYDPEKLNVDQGETASLRAKGFLPDTQIVEGNIEMKPVTGMVNTFEGITSQDYDSNKKIAVGVKFQYWSIIKGNGYSTMAPRYYVMSSDDKVVTGIEEVGAEQEAVPALSTVYNLQGVAVRVNVATETALEGLPAGIYIVNGRKWSVR